MADFQSDAFVFFGATGDLAHKQIFPSLQGLIRDEGFNLPIVGVAKAGWNLDHLKARAKDSLEKHGVLDAENARVVVEKPLGRDLASSPELNRILHRYFPKEGIFRIDHFLGNEPVQNILHTRAADDMPPYASAYEPGTWGPGDSHHFIADDGPWIDPKVQEEK